MQLHSMFLIFKTDLDGFYFFFFILSLKSIWVIAMCFNVVSQSHSGVRTCLVLRSVENRFDFFYQSCKLSTSLSFLYQLLEVLYIFLISPSYSNDTNILFQLFPSLSAPNALLETLRERIFKPSLSTLISENTK